MSTDLLASLPEIVVTDFETCGLVIATGEGYDDEEDVLIVGPFNHVLSIDGSWDEDFIDPPGGWEAWQKYPAQKLRLQFDDVQESNSHGGGPTTTHIDKILAFADGISGRVLIHCAAGISRSTAAALIIIASILEPGQEELAVQHLCSIKKYLRPHRNMIRMADEFLDRDGRLLAAYEAVWGSR